MGAGGLLGEGYQWTCVWPGPGQRDCPPDLHAASPSVALPAPVCAPACPLPPPLPPPLGPGWREHAQRHLRASGDAHHHARQGVSAGVRGWGGESTRGLEGAGERGNELAVGRVAHGSRTRILRALARGRWQVSNAWYRTVAVQLCCAVSIAVACHVPYTHTHTHTHTCTRTPPPDTHTGTTTRSGWRSTSSS